ncbi:DUF6074 family protein [Bradyrhizobium sp. SSUT77]|uniref:DUF6074 family protein n=1 Tax=Bradyrhizobium sp. SSUT77 TaxID=3040603 RepID=UPI00244B59D6|nr:DUF6074 family protein [Bradyrhizobium sp. SSUT77]MDH2341499.1 DUF6074 family protein [Bradyrhizobium sp. SSUT77]
MKPEAVPSALVCVFPPARHKKIVAFIVRDMRKKRSADAAEKYLIDHLDLEWSRLSDLGVAEAEIELHCRAFAVAAWTAYFKDREARGIA